MPGSIPKMPDAIVLRPDREFLKSVLAEGGADVKKCVQCATCSVVCELSTGRKPFPRKEMLWAQWGLKDRLIADPDIWLCHQCNDCSTHCPRGARPADVLAAVRHQAVKHYATPRFLAEWMSQVKTLPLMLLIAAALVGFALFVRGPLEAALPFEVHHEFYADFFPHWLLIGYFSSLTGLAALVVLVGALRFWKAMKAHDDSPGGGTVVLGIVPSFANVVKSILIHDRFSKCTSQAARRVAHLTAFYGFVALFVVTVWAVLDLYVNPLLGIDSMYPFGLLHPMKILANVGAVLLIYGSVRAVGDRMGGGGDTPVSTAFDLTFVWLLLFVGVSGVCTEILRFVGEPADIAWLTYAAYSIYFLHLVGVVALLVYLPYSKFAHIVYRTVAMVYAEHTGRNLSDSKSLVPVTSGPVEK
jgi:quinone-modifying oxidoreductase subunit QmoC